MFECSNNLQPPPTGVEAARKQTGVCWLEVDAWGWGQSSASLGPLAALRWDMVIMFCQWMFLLRLDVTRKPNRLIWTQCLHHLLSQKNKFESGCFSYLRRNKYLNWVNMNQPSKKAACLILSWNIYSALQKYSYPVKFCCLLLICKSSKKSERGKTFFRHCNKVW